MSKLCPLTGEIGAVPAVTTASSLDWKAVAADDTGFVNIHPQVDCADGVVYLAARVKVAKGGTWDVRLGYDGAVRVFADGTPVFVNAERQNPALPDRSVFPLELRKGAHEIVVALDTAKGMGWGIYLRFQVPKAMRKKLGKPVFPV